MSDIQTDLETLDAALRLYFYTMKRPQQWAQVTAHAGVSLDRPAAIILRVLSISRDQGWRVQDLATELGIEAPSVTRKTQELEQLGYVRRTRNQLDKRAIGLELTARGKTVINRIYKAQLQIIRQVISEWTVEDRQNFVRLFQRFSRDFSNQQIDHT